MTGAKVILRHPRIGRQQSSRQQRKTKDMKLNTHIHKAAATALCILSLSPALMFAAGSPKPIEERGVIKSVDMNAHTLVVTEHKKNSEHTFQWNDQTKFSERDKGASPSDLKEGERVHLSYTPGGDTPILRSVEIVPAKTEKHSANNLSPARSNRAQA
jgi:hypothetical protein